MTLIKPFYSIVELSIIFQKKYLATRHILKELNIPVHRIGARLYVYASEIQENTPDLWRSIFLCAEDNNAVVQQSDFQHISN